MIGWGTVCTFGKINYERAFLWSEDKKTRGEIKTPSVIGAIINLGYSCDFLDTKYIRMLRPYYQLMVASYEQSGKSLPENRDLSKDKFRDKILRELDCAVIEFMHSEIYNQVQTDIKEKGFSELKIFDSARGVFTEGGPAFEGAGIFEKSHIQVCIRNLNCIKGFFLPRKEIDFMQWLKKNNLNKE